MHLRRALALCTCVVHLREAGVAAPRAAPYGGLVMKARRPFRIQPEPETTSDLMAGLLSRMGGTGRAREYRVFEAYREAAGTVLRARTMPDSFREGTLFIRVTNSALAHELTLLRGELLTRLETALGPGVVTAIRTRVGSLPSDPDNR